MNELADRRSISWRPTKNLARLPKRESSKGIRTSTLHPGNSATSRGFACKPLFKAGCPQHLELGTGCGWVWLHNNHNSHHYTSHSWACYIYPAASHVLLLQNMAVPTVSGMPEQRHRSETPSFASVELHLQPPHMPAPTPMPVMALHLSISKQGFSQLNSLLPATVPSRQHPRVTALFPSVASFLLHVLVLCHYCCRCSYCCCCCSCYRCPRPLFYSARVLPPLVASGPSSWSWHFLR